VSKLKIDWTRCDGHGLCHALMPERIRIDEWGFPVISDSPLAKHELAAARRIVGTCPALALRVETAKSVEVGR